MFPNVEVKIGVIGLGYVGLPLAVEFGKKFPTLGFDINANRIDELRSGHDSTQEVSARNWKSLPNSASVQIFNTSGTPRFTSSLCPHRLMQTNALILAH